MVPSNYTIKPVGLSGLARTGKDTFCQALIKEYRRRGVAAKRFALADELKLDLDPFLKEKFGISAFTKDEEEKGLIRDLLVAHGKIHRIRSEGTYWAKILDVKIKAAMQANIVPIVTDLRYMEYEYDEVDWFQKGVSGTLVHLRRDNEDGSRRLPPNIHEEKNDPVIESIADHKLVLPTVVDLVSGLDEFTKNFVDTLYGD